MAAELEEREDQVVVARIQVEPQLDDRPRLLEIGVRLFHRTHVRDLRELRDRLRVQIQDDAAGNVVRHDGPVGDGRDLLEVADDPSHRWLRVVRRHHEEAVNAELVGARGQVDGVLRRVGPRSGDHRRPIADLVDRGLVQLEPLVVGERRRLARRPVRRRRQTVRDQVRRESSEALDIDRPVPLKGVTIAVRTSPSTPKSYGRARPSCQEFATSPASRRARSQRDGRRSGRRRRSSTTGQRHRERSRQSTSATEGHGRVTRTQRRRPHRLRHVLRRRGGAIVSWSA